MLMAASDIRRMTKDADLSARVMVNDEERVREVVTEIIAIDPEPPFALDVSFGDPVLQVEVSCRRM
jgi:hypothetical protein